MSDGRGVERTGKPAHLTNDLVDDREGAVVSEDTGGNKKGTSTHVTGRVKSFGV